VTRPVTIVLVDDSPDLRLLVRTQLGLTGGFDVVGEAGSGAEAVDVVTGTRPDLVLLDLSMPQVDGFDSLAGIRQGAPSSKVVVFSGFDAAGLADRALALGAAAFVEKSEPVERLVATLLAVAGRPSAATAEEKVEPPLEELLAEHHERFRDAFDQAAIGMATLTLTGRIVRANAALEALAATTIVVGTPYVDLAAEDDRGRVAGELAAAAGGGADVAGFEHRMLTGAIVDATASVVRDAPRRPLYLFLQVLDVSERRRAEEELRRSEERFRLLVQGVKDYAIFMLDPDGRVASWNEGAERIKGYRADEIVGRHFSAFYPAEATAAGHPQHELEIALAEGTYEEEGWRVRKDGSTFWANVVITAIHDEHGRHVGFAKVTRDVTERRRLQEGLRQAAAERVELLAMTAHELRTPVTVVKGFVSTLHDHWDELEPEHRQQIIGSLARSGDRLSRLVDDIFTAARLESGAVEVHPSSFDVAALVEEVVADQDARAFTVDAPPAAVWADRGRTQQMIANYLTNALRYGEPPFRVTVVRSSGHVDVTVADAGGGVDASVADRLFTKFATGSRAEGTGLGLFIVRELARAQGGDAWYEPAPGGGARFGIRLPAPPGA
jgi:PAS domain S-box-containing protein